MSAYNIVPFDPAVHGSWVYDTFRLSVRPELAPPRPGKDPATPQFPWGLIPVPALLGDLKRHLTTAVTLVAVAKDDPDEFMAWAAVRPVDNEVLFAFTKHALRRRFGLASSLCLAGGVDLTRRTGVRYWTRAAERISRRPGYHLYARVTDDAPANDNAAKEGTL
jgi:hypothetical protein